jgi:alkylation response protein AidB-like acyl-CoA dehydrogenase
MNHLSAALPSLLPEIRSRRDEIEQSRRLPADLAKQMRASGIFRMTVPRSIGGEEASPLEVMRMIETVAAADGSAGWCAMIGAGNNVVSGYINERGAREVFADPTAPVGGVAAPIGAATRTAGGWNVSGRWPFASGINHSDWVWLGCMVMEDGKPVMTAGGPEMLHVCVPVGDINVHDTWFVSGLSGTGSNDVSTEGVFVPEHRTFMLFDPAGHRPEPLYRMPPMGLFIYQLACVSLGIARSALDEFAEIAQTKVPTLYEEPLADQSVIQVEVARLEAALRSARSFLYDTVEEIWRTVNSGSDPDMRQLALGRLASSHAVATGAEVAGRVSTLGGGSALYSKSSLQRHARDAGAVTHHFTVAPQTWVETGRVLLGRQPSVPVF